ncbi:MAG: hypothetical protein GX089_11890 [Fibrobacter sp.]|nr:hypothetical protein [Fibrobacter sp.]
MINFLKQAVSNFRFADFLDILVLSLFLYFVFTWLRRKASRAIVISISAVFILYLSARLLNMYITSHIFQAGFTAALVVLAIIFQDDIRMAVEHLASMGSYRSKRQLLASNRTVESIVSAVCSLARDRIGALIVIRGRELLDRHLSGGISVDGRISVPLLYSIFHPETPMHDGAVILEGDRIDKFAVRLPLSHNLSEVGNVGTRHTAALGLSERSDAMVLVVSEERGTISIAESGHLEIVDKDKLRIRIDDFYNHILPSPTTKKRSFKLTSNARLKLVSLFLSIVLWLAFANRVETVNRTYTVPVEYRNAPSGWVIENPSPEQVKVSLTGQERAFNFDHTTLVVSLDVKTLKEGSHSIPITDKNLNLPKGLSVTDISPGMFTFHAYQIEQVELPVTVKTKGKVPGNLEVTEIKVAPQSLRMTIRSSRKNQYSEIPTEVLDLSQIKQNTVLRLKVNTPPGTQLLNEDQQWIRVNVNVKHK